MDKAFKPYLDSARKVRAARTRGKATTGAASATRTDLSEIRAWAKANGHEVSERGRIAASVTEAYDAAH